ncbi:MAG TPA: hypothetical protein DEB09_02125 [Candidatus Magasanikbacteria bacterium]|nr:hypothetical protein [Candidatus Magasanikbacteria bacterium]
MTKSFKISSFIILPFILIALFYLINLYLRPKCKNYSTTECNKSMLCKETLQISPLDSQNIGISMREKICIPFFDFWTY